MRVFYEPPLIQYIIAPSIAPHRVEADVMLSGHTRLKSRQVTPFVINRLLTTAIVAGEVRSGGSGMEQPHAE